MIETRQDYDVIVLSEGVTGWARRLLITHEDMSYHATLFHTQGDGYELIFRDIDYPEWAEDFDLMELDNQTWGAVNE
jgi:hypothetical protein